MRDSATGDPLRVDLCVVGAGSAGLVVAAGASQMGASVVLIERGEMGGDCLNVGCVPSKSLIAAAAQAQAMRGAAPFGIAPVEPAVDFARVQDHVASVIDAIAPHDSVERYTGLGVRVIRAHARFTGPDEVAAGGTLIRARRFVVATGSRPAVPDVRGLDGVPYLTNETVFGNRTLPRHLVVIGGGPIGIELAQAHRRLGAAATVLQHGTILPEDDPELVEVVRRRLRAEGIVLHEQATVEQAEPTADGMRLQVGTAGGRLAIEGSHLLVAAGREVVTDGLGLEAAGIQRHEKGITVDRGLRTTNRRVYAIGDCIGDLQFTHAASYHAGLVLRSALFRLPVRMDRGAIPWVTYCDPELAQAGLTEAAARAAGERVNVLRFPMADNNRAQTERETAGLIKVVLRPNGRILGAGIAAAQAGELILPWVLALRQRLKIGAMAGIVAPYPTLGEASKSAAGTFYIPKLFTARTRRIVRLLARLG